jgi:hypothetical protein
VPNALQLRKSSFARGCVAAFTIALCLCTAATCALADTPQSVLDAITSRGRALYEYDVNAARATDSAAALLKPAADAGLLGVYVGSLASDGTWTFDFGKSSADGSFAVVIEAKQTSAGSKQYLARPISPPRKETGWIARAALAVVTMRAVFVAVPWRNYNYAVLDAGSSQFYVYMFPGQVSSNSYPFGGDARFLISADGTTILEQQRMHRAVVDVPNAPKQQSSGSTVHAFAHNDITGPLPQDSDVMYSLRRDPPLEQDVLAGGHLFVIAPDGSITDKGPVPAMRRSSA